MENDLGTRLLISTSGCEEEGGPLRQRVWEESKKLWVVAAPAIFTRFTTFGIPVIGQAYVGHIGGTTDLAAFALIFTVLARFSSGVLLGMSSALETLCGQAYGAGRHHMLGIYLQQSWIVLLCTATLLLPLFIFAPTILALVGQAEEIAQASASISLWFIPVLYAFLFSYTLQMYLQSQSKNLIISYLAALSILLHVSLSWLISSKPGWGVHGVMFSMNLAYWIPNVGQFLFVFCGGCPRTWTGFSTRSFANLWPVVKLSASSGVMICVRVSNELGRGSASAVKFSILVVVGTSFAIGFLLFLIFMAVGGRVAYVFTDDGKVVEAVSRLSSWLALSILLNSVQPVLSAARAQVLLLVQVGKAWWAT
ncbi:protein DETOXIFICATION 21-like isoform X2 [Nymphaea colorata]|uniref:protein DETOXIFICATION 21-like isoform X2 n=1 Tax=Nymphaea colorata TaxID=210225 RepID=UPI00214E4BAE|nr:protein DETOXIFICATION 21-like isoform X2 [Nymphaea colorata]